MIRRTPIRFLATAAAIPLIGLAAAACGSGGGNATAATSPAKAAPTQSATVSLASAGALGKILVDSQGRTLYLFKKDTGTTSTCVGACVAVWPPLRTTGRPTAGSGLTASKLGTSKRSDGNPQVIYNGHPLYLYAGDQKPGDTTGQGINGFGAPWFALSAGGTQVSGHVMASSSSSLY
jgi:predicted lipoprotein with Yx(FWY)xxD motif